MFAMTRVMVVSGSTTNRPADVLATYLPMTGEDGTILGVFEIYTDVSGETAQTRRTRTLMIAARVRSASLNA